MKAIENYENIKASSGEFARPGNGGYILEIVNVTDVPYNEQTGKGDYLRIDYDIAAGDFKGYYTAQNERFGGGKWFANVIKSYKEKALGMFKHFINCVEESNSGYKWTWDEQSLVNKYIGVVLGEEEYKKRDGSVGVKLVVKDIKTIDQILKGDFKVPTIKKLAETASATAAPKWEEIDSLGDLPF